MSFFFLLCGGAGSGKSMRAMRMQDLLCDGWIKKSGTTSARAGMNGGMDDLCGRLVYYDEYATHSPIRAALALTLDPLAE